MLRTLRFAVPALLILCCPGAFALQDFTFVQFSDLHYPYLRGDTARLLAAVPGKPFVLPGTEAKVPAPAFAIATGDLNEFGGGRGDWEGLSELLKGLPLRVHLQLGNHDNTWDCGRERLRKLEGSPFYAFQYGGAKFIGFDTATPQDPRPTAATEGLNWLRRELARTPPAQPVFFFCHHPLNGTEFASSFARERLLEVLRTRNVVLALVGHGHSAVAQRYDALDAVMGGSTYGDKRGFSIISVKGGQLRVVHQYLLPEPHAVTLLDKPLRLSSRAPYVGRLAPAEGTIVRRPTFPVALRTPGLAWARCCHFTCEKVMHCVSLTKGIARTVLPTPGAPGAHVLTAEVKDVGGGLRSSGAFWVEGGPWRIRWLRQIPGQCQAGLRLAGGKLYVASNDGCLRALNAASGATLWSARPGGEVRGTLLVLADGRVCVAASDGTLRCFSPAGKLLWRRATGAPVYSSPARAGGRILCANNSGSVVAVSPADGRLLWRCSKPSYTIESGFASAERTAYTGSWDRYVYALDLLSGAVRWRALSRGSARTAAPQYYSPADCAPVCAGGRVFVCDRAGYLNIYRGDTGELIRTEEGASAVGAATDGNVYLRRSGDRLSKLRPDGSVVWERAVKIGFVPVPPVEADGCVWVVSSLGLLSALDARTGALLGEFQVSPQLYVFAAPAARGNDCYVVDEGGHLLALQLKKAATGGEGIREVAP